MSHSIYWEPQSILAVDRAPHSTYGMRIERLPNGAMLLGVDGAGPDKSLSLVYQSDDNGETWKFLSIASFAEGDAANTQLRQLPGGELLSAYRDVRWITEKSLQVTLRVSVSNDGGVSWRHRSNIAETRLNGFRGVWEPYLDLLPDGSLAVMYASEAYQPEWPQIIAMKISHDAGLTWGREFCISRHPASRDGMPVFGKMPDGGVYLVFEATDAVPQEFVIRAKYSPDGYRWDGPRQLIYRPALPAKKAGAPYVAIHPDGRLFVSFQTDEDRAGSSEPACDFKMIYSEDHGLTWSNPLTLIPAPFANWGGLFLASEKLLLAGASAQGDDKVHRTWLRRAHI